MAQRLRASISETVRNVGSSRHIDLSMLSFSMTVKASADAITLDVAASSKKKDVGDSPIW